MTCKIDTDVTVETKTAANVRRIHTMAPQPRHGPAARAERENRATAGTAAATRAILGPGLHVILW